jgi:hypothetical protein
MLPALPGVRRGDNIVLVYLAMPRLMVRRLTLAECALASSRSRSVTYRKNCRWDGRRHR